MSSLLLAIQFLTTLPLRVRSYNDKKMAWSLVYFPVVGLCLGLVLVGLNALLFLCGIFGLTANIILVIALIILSGGMHLDGLADTADAFLSGKTKQDMLEIMRDSHIGVMGVLALVSIILLKTGLLFSLDFAVKPAALVLTCVLSRWSPVLLMYLFPYARREGKAKLFIQGINSKILLISTLIAAGCSFWIWQMPGLCICLIVALTTFLMGRFTQRKIGGITGDTLGATIEITEVVILLTVNIIQGSIYG